MFIAISIHKSREKRRYTTMLFPNSIDKTHDSTTFITVPATANVTGRTSLFILNEPENLPARKPVSVFVKAFKPIGAADKKSRNKPLKKPADEPAIDEFMNETYSTINNVKSGRTGINGILASTDA